MARVVRRVVHHADRRKTDTPNQESAEKSGESRGENSVRPRGGSCPGARHRAKRLRLYLHEIMIGRTNQGVSPAGFEAGRFLPDAGRSALPRTALENAPETSRILAPVEYEA